MNNQLLDKLLKSLKDDFNGERILEKIFFEKHQDSMDKREWNRIRALLIRKNFIRRDHSPGKVDFRIQLKPEGERFLEEGGFSEEAEYREETLEVAKESRKWAKKAFWAAVIIGIITLAVSILLFCLDRKRDPANNDKSQINQQPADIPPMKRDTIIIHDTVKAPVKPDPTKSKPKSPTKKG